MTDGVTDGVTDVQAAFEDARARLKGSPQDRLGELIVPRKMLGLQRPPRVEPRASVWHIGVLLVGETDVYGVGQIVRAREQVRRGFTSESERERDALAGAARRGGFAEGEVVHLDWERIDVDAVGRGEASGPLATRDGAVCVRWSKTGWWMPLQAYLDEQIELHVHPPRGAT